MDNTDNHNLWLSSKCDHIAEDGIKQERLLTDIISPIAYKTKSNKFFKGIEQGLFHLVRDLSTRLLLQILIDLLHVPRRPRSDSKISHDFARHEL